MERWRRVLLAGACLVMLAACSGGSGDDDAGDGGPCSPADCQTRCESRGYLTGTCSGALCQCSGTAADADADVEPDAAGDDGSVGDEGGGEEDAGAEDAEEVEVDPCSDPVCGRDELCGESGQGDGVDNDCDTTVDEECPCTIGTSMPCFPGDPTPCPLGAPCRGACTRGVQVCGEFGWGVCMGVRGPTPESCDGLDNDCNGLYDDGIPGCDLPVNCPGTTRAAPMSYVPLDGGSIYPRTDWDRWLWEFFCPATIPTCPLPEDPAAQDTQVLLISSGTYRARATIWVGDDIYTCEYAIVTQGDGLRVELTWDTQGSGRGDTDVDLHLHEMGPDTSPFFSEADCYYANCKGSSYSSLDWGLAPTTDLAACRDAPHGEGDEWVSRGHCANPRLDVDVITCNPASGDPTSYDYCAPENINVDNPPLGRPFRVMVNYYSSHSFSGITNASINIYCGGALRASLGPQELRVSGSSSGDNWMVADVLFYEGLCGELDCEIVPLDTVINGPAFGPPWSAFTHGAP